MPTNRIRRTRSARPSTITDRMRLYLETGDYCGRGLPPDSPGKVETFMLGNPNAEGRERLRAIWLLHRKDIHRQWTADKRPGRPWAAKKFDKAAAPARERRRNA